MQFEKLSKPLFLFHKVKREAKQQLISKTLPPAVAISRAKSGSAHGQVRGALIELPRAPPRVGAIFSALTTDDRQLSHLYTRVMECSVGALQAAR